MRFLSSASAFSSAAALVFGCSVYDTELVQSAGGLTGAGNSGTSADGGKGVGGKDSASAGSTNGEAGNGTGGSFVTPEGGAADGGDGMGGAPSAGTGGSVGGAMGGTTTGGTATGGKGGMGGTAAGGKGGTTGAAGMSGNAGTGGGATVPKCGDNPVPAKASWIASASSESVGTGVESDGLYNPAKHMTDSSFVERWSSGQPQAGNEWIQIDFGKPVSLTGITLNVRGNQGDYPRMFAVRMSNKVKDFAAPILAMGSGVPSVDDPDNTNIPFSEMSTGQYLTVRQTGAVAMGDNAWWTITELSVVCE